MKNVFKYLGIFLTVALAAGFTACNPTEENESAEAGLDIKVFFPTKVIAGQSMTINGSGFKDATEVIFPEGIKAESFEIVGDGMIRVVAPAGIAADGGNIIVRSAEDEAVSPLPLTLGNVSISGFSKQPGDTLQGGEQLTIYGKDLEFLNKIEVLDPDGNPVLIGDKSFYRKGTSFIVITMPQDIYTGVYTGKLYSCDGQEYSLPELYYEPAPTGHWETVKTLIWKNDGTHGNINWSGEYRFAPESNSTGEEIYTVPQDIWNKMKETTFYMSFAEPGAQIRVTTGWWSTNWTSDDIFVGNELITDNGDGTYSLAVTLAGSPILDVLDDQHLLFTGGGYTPLEVYFSEEVWVENGSGPKEVVIWENDGSHGNINWSGEYRFAPESNSTGEEVYTVPQDIWDNVIKKETFYMQFAEPGAQIRVTTGWWSTNWTSDDIFVGNELITENEDGTYSLAVNLAGSPILDVLDAQHLLFTGGGYTVLKLYYLE
ncbi:MAG: hypothetical protein J6U28_03930 [Bacteroidales bacterium]|nr:hypothetical protein [Bacteroidales bacterium]MBO7622746.1 hypothetical protein [Bacteroidales bacterium]